MTKLSELNRASKVHGQQVQADPDARAEYNRTAFAHAVATRIISYRVENGLSQSALARLLGMQQPAIARLEAGDHQPSLTILGRLAQGLGLEFRIDVTPSALELQPAG